MNFISISIVTFLTSAAALAGGYFEPHAGITSGTYQVERDRTDNTGEYSAQMTGFGGNAGFKIGGVYDYLYLFGDFQATGLGLKGDGTTFQDEFTTVLTAGLGFSIDWNIPIRTTFIFDTINKSTTTNLDINGKGSRFIISYYMNLKWLVNFQMQTFNDTTFTSVGSGTDTATDASRYTIFSLGLSFPMDFNYPKTSWKKKAVY